MLKLIDKGTNPLSAIKHISKRFGADIHELWDNYKEDRPEDAQRLIDGAKARAKRMPWAIVERRKTMIGMMDSGFSISSIAFYLSLKYGVSDKTIWKDYQKRDVWLPSYKDLMQTAEEMRVWFNGITAFSEKVLKEQALNGDNSNARVGAAKGLMDLGFKRMELSQSMGITARVPAGLEVSGRMVTEVVDKSGLWLDAVTNDMEPDELKVLLKNVAKIKTAAESV